MSRKTWVLVAVVLGSAIVFLDSTVVNVALPRIGRELPTERFGTLEAQSYVYYGYLLTLSALLVLAGALSDYFGRRRMFALGLSGFGVTSVFCGLAPTMELLIASRVLQGAAGALLVPGSLSIITASFEGEEQGRSFGIWAAATSGVTIFGPALGGALIAYSSWRAVFLINVPLVALGVWATLRYVPESRDEEASGHFDWWGALAAVLAVGGLTFGVIRGQSQGWTQSPVIVALLAGVAATIAFPVLMRRVPHPLVPPSLFRSRNFTVTNLSTLVIYGALYVTFQYFALFAIGVLGYNELAFGLAGIPGPLFLVLFSTRFGKLAVRFGPRWFMAIGPAIMGLGLLWFARIPVDSEPWRATLGQSSSLLPPRDYLVDVLPALLVFGIGLMVMVAPLTTALMRSVPVRNSGVASAFNNAISRVGPQVAGALLFVAITASFYANLAERVPRLDVSSPQVRESITALNPPRDVGEKVRAAASASSTEAFHLAVIVAALLCLIGAGINAAGIRNDELRSEEPAPTAPGPTPAGTVADVQPSA